MLLAEYINSLPTESGPRHVAPLLDSIQYFQFGDLYTVTAHGFNYRLPDLDTALEMINSEFAACPQYMPLMRVIGIDGRVLSRTAQVLRVIPESWDNCNADKMWVRNEVLRKVRIATLTYHLTDSWDQFHGMRNL